MEVVYVIVAILVLAALKAVYDKTIGRKKDSDKLAALFGKQVSLPYTDEKMKSINAYSSFKKNELSIDDITANDLNLNVIFKDINSCVSCLGEEYLYSMLMNPSNDQKVLMEREKLISYFSEHKSERDRLRYAISDIGRLTNISFFEYMNRLGNISKDSTLLHFVCMGLFLATLGTVFIDPTIGIISLLVVYAVNMVLYFKRKSIIEPYYNVIASFTRILECCDGIGGLDIPELEEYLDRLALHSRPFKGIKNLSFIVLSPRSGAGDILQSLLDYIRMALHLDLLFFNHIVDLFLEQNSHFVDLFETVGILDSCISIASFRKLHSDWCIPEHFELAEGEKASVEIKEVYHPLIENAVTNSISVSRDCLITGSNASGKSTFIRTVAIAAVLSQSIHTVPAAYYRAPYYKILSSMALSDNVLNGESYYMVEIRSLKRIFDSAGKVPVLCFIDEVLRGTNTIERVAASSVLLNDLAGKNALVFAATHDLELTQILAARYNNYHFEEHVTDNDVTFDYKLREGSSRTRNAIKLLKRFGYPDEVTGRASELAEGYVSTGNWEEL